MKNTTFFKAYSGIQKEVWLLALAQLVNRIGTMVIFFLSIYLKDHLHFDIPRVGWAMGFFGAGSLTGVLLGGRIADRFGYRLLMTSSLLLGGSLFIVASFVTSFEWLCLVLFLMSCIGEAFRPANMASVGHYSSPENYTRSVSLLRLATNLGFSFGPAIGGWIAGISYQSIFIVDGLSSIAAGFMLAVFLKKGNLKKTTQVQKNVDDTRALGPLSDKLFLFFLPLATLYSAAFLQFFTTMPLYYKDVAALSESQIGWLVSLNGLIVAVFEMVLIYKIENKWNQFNFIFIGALILVASYVTFLFTDSIQWIILNTVLISFSEMFALPFMNTFMNSRASENTRGSFASFYTMSWSASQVITPPAAAFIIERYGFHSLWICMTIIALSVCVGILRLKKMVETAQH
jgi:MFS family permease